jgi:hypothetical protein
MANTYTKFSTFLLEWDDVGLSSEEIDFLNQSVKDFESLKTEPVLMEIQTSTKNDGSLFSNAWFYSDSNYDPFEVARVVESFIKKFKSRRDLVFCLEWVNYCSNLRADEFYGGCIIVTRKGIKEFNTGDFIKAVKSNDDVRRFKKSVKREALKLCSGEVYVVAKDYKGCWKLLNVKLPGVGTPRSDVSAEAVGAAIVFGGNVSKGGES